MGKKKDGFTVFSRLNTAGVYLKIGSFDPAFFPGRRLVLEMDRFAIILCFAELDYAVPYFARNVTPYRALNAMPRNATSNSVVKPYREINERTFKGVLSFKFQRRRHVSCRSIVTGSFHQFLTQIPCILIQIVLFVTLIC